MPIGGILGGLVSGVGGLFGASQQSDALNKAIDLSKQQTRQQRTDLMPYMNYGRAALPYLFESLIPDSEGTTLPAAPIPTDPTLRDRFIQSPGYQYNLEQITDAVQNSAAGKTGALSGNMLRALQTNASGLASDDWWKFYDRLNTNWTQRAQAMQNLISGGRAAAAGSGELGQSGVSSISNLLATQGSSNAAGTTGLFNSLGNALTSGWGYLFSGSGGSGGGSDYGSWSPRVSY